MANSLIEPKTPYKIEIYVSDDRKVLRAPSYISKSILRELISNTELVKNNRKYTRLDSSQVRRTDWGSGVMRTERLVFEVESA